MSTAEPFSQKSSSALMTSDGRKRRAGVYRLRGGSEPLSWDTPQEPGSSEGLSAARLASHRHFWKAHQLTRLLAAAEGQPRPPAARSPLAQYPSPAERLGEHQLGGNSRNWAGSAATVPGGMRKQISIAQLQALAKIPLEASRALPVWRRAMVSRLRLGRWIGTPVSADAGGKGLEGSITHTPCLAFPFLGRRELFLGAVPTGCLYPHSVISNRLRFTTTKATLPRHKFLTISPL